MKCENCGADSSTAAETCDYCGAHLASSTSTAAANGPAAVFARVKQSVEYANRDAPDRLARLPKYSGIHKVMLSGFFVVFIAISAFMFIGALSMAGVFGFIGFQAQGGFGAAFSLVPLVMAVVPLGFIGLGVFMFINVRKKMSSIETDPVRAMPVVVVDKRLSVSGGSGDSSARTQYYVTCETEAGSRDEYQVWDGKTYGRMAAGDAGILYVRAGCGLDFDRVVAHR